MNLPRPLHGSNCLGSYSRIEPHAAGRYAAYGDDPQARRNRSTGFGRGFRGLGFRVCRASKPSKVGSAILIQLLNVGSMLESTSLCLCLQP